MTLKENFETTMVSFLIDKNQDKTMLDHFDKIADEFAIEFVNWIVNPDTTDLLHDLELVVEIDKEVKPEKLLEIYKKEKGL
jgi:hypothetical protein